MAEDHTYKNAERRAYMLAEEMEKAQLTNGEIRNIFLEVYNSRTPLVADNLPEIEEPE